MKNFSPPPKPLPGGKAPAKLTIVGSVYHSRPGQQPRQIESRYERWLTSDVPPHEDEFSATNEWQPIRVGRGSSTACLVVENLEGTRYTRVPTPEEDALIRSRVVELSLVPSGSPPQCLAPLIVVPTGEDVRFGLAPGVTAYARCAAPGQTADLRATSISS